MLSFHIAITLIAAGTAGYFGHILATNIRYHGINRYTAALAPVVAGQAALAASALLQVLGTAASTL